MTAPRRVPIEVVSEPRRTAQARGVAPPHWRASAIPPSSRMVPDVPPCGRIHSNHALGAHSRRTTYPDQTSPILVGPLHPLSWR